jgi:SAM-dependent methyltransferase
VLNEDERVARTAYDQLASDYAAAFPDLTAETAGDRSLIDAFAAGVTAAGPVLDVGCGTGRVSAHLADLGLAPVGVDLSSRMLSEARGLHPELPLVLGSLARLPFASATASGVLAWYSLIHTAPDDLSVVVAELSRVLAPGAPLLVAFQCGHGERLERPSAFGRCVRRVSYRHDVEQVVDLLANHRLRLVERVAREPAAPHEMTAQAFLLAVRHPLD